MFPQPLDLEASADRPMPNRLIAVNTPCTLQQEEARITVDPADRAPGCGRYPEGRESGGDCADVERPANSARDTGSGAGPLRRLHGDMAKASHSRRAAQTTRPMTWTSAASRS